MQPAREELLNSLNIYSVEIGTRQWSLSITPLSLVGVHQRQKLRTASRKVPICTFTVSSITRP